MFLLDDQVIYSATDLTAAADCEWAVMRALDARLGRVPAVLEPEDEMLRRTAELGDLHERRALAEFKRGREVIEFARPTLTELAAAAAETEAALRGGAEALFQATFFDGRFVGFADFIIRGDDGRYEVYDTKLARKAKVKALLQLAAYGEQLLERGIPTGERVHLLLGDGSTSSHRLGDILPVYRIQRRRLQRILDDRVADAQATAWGDPRYTACGRCAACTEQVQAHRDVLLVAGMRPLQRAKLLAAGVTTIDELAARSEPVAGMTESAVENLRDQARLQLDDDFGYRVYDPTALAVLPAPDPGDIFFDFEGDPLYQEGSAWGLDYLFGLVEADGTFRAFWAHDLPEERQALIDFLGYVAERRRRHPGMHIYHYAAYERTHLLSLAARHGVGEDAVDDLLRDNVLVDLYPVVKKSVRVGSPSYSLKKLEPLYMGASQREGVANAADSVTEYVRWRELREAGRTDSAAAAQAAAVLADIEQYNTYDCLSTLRLRDWLLERAAEHGVLPADRSARTGPAAEREPSPVYTRLTTLLEPIPRAERDADHSALALAAAAIDYHRREAKSFWWAHFTRLVAPVSDWADTRDVLIVREAVVARDWAVDGRERTASRLIRVVGEEGPGSSFGVGTNGYLVYDPPFPPIEDSRDPGARRAHPRMEIVAVEPGAYLVKEKLRTGVEAYQQLPLAITPQQPPNAGSQVGAIAWWGERVLDALPGMLPDPAMDILRRVPPRLRSTGPGARPGAAGDGDAAGSGAAAHGSLAPVREGDHVGAITDSILRLDRSYLAVQGPPGTGKTYTGSRVIARLVLEHGWKVGVVAQSHAAVENMLTAVRAAGVPADRVGKKPKDGDAREPDWTGLDAAAVEGFVAAPGGRVIGGTAWDFSNPDRIGRGVLDLLVVDEAGQFSLAATIAAAVGARRLLLLGDPQQLPQVSQGLHPEPVDLSALGWLSDGHDVLPEEFGYFLDTSWRMHPEVCGPVSRLSYEGRLESRAPERRLEGVAPGLHPHPVVPSAPRSTASPEEADAVVARVRGLIGRRWESDGRTGPLAERDVIVVAPYNAQVSLIGERLAAAGYPDVPVGTVDRFQGQEAAVAIISLAASSAGEAPRGLEFLLMPNRLNVAISRAQWAAYLLYSPALTEHLPRTVTALTQLSAFIRLVGPQ